MSEQRLIDANKLKSLFRQPIDYTDAYCIRMIDAAPTIKPKRGEWIDNECFDEKYGHSYDCGLCGYSVIGQQNFCPNCGADMRKE